MASDAHAASAAHDAIDAASPADPRENTRGLAPTVGAEAATLQTNVLVSHGDVG